MIGRLKSVVFDCPEPISLAHFYQGMLGGILVIDDDETGPDGDGWVDLIAEHTYPRVSFQRAADYVAPHWPSGHGEQQLHLDIEVDDMGAADERVRALGARCVEKHDGFSVYLDPVGHPFCLIAP